MLVKNENESPVPAAKRILELRTDVVHEMEGNRLIRLEETTDLLASMREEGQLVPGLVRKLSEAPATYLVLAGHRRLFCCRILGRPFLALEVEGDADDSRLLKLAITDNAVRKQLTLIELGESLERFAQASGLLGSSELAQALNMSQSEVSKARALPKKLAPELHPIVRDRAVGRTLVELIASVPDHGKQRELMAWVIETKPKREQLEIRVAELKGKKPKTNKAMLLRLGTCKLEVRDPTPESLQSFLDCVSAALRKAAKESLPLSVLPSLLGR